MAYQISAQLGFGMAFATSFYVIFCIKERVSKAKHLQFVSGADVFVFWATSYLYDILTYFVSMCGILITLAILQEDGFKTSEDLGIGFLLSSFFWDFLKRFNYTRMNLYKY